MAFLARLECWMMGPDRRGGVNELFLVLTDTGRVILY
jgi:hypothetical protein